MGAPVAPEARLARDDGDPPARLHRRPRRAGPFPERGHRRVEVLGHERQPPERRRPRRRIVLRLWRSHDLDERLGQQQEALPQRPLRRAGVADTPQLEARRLQRLERPRGVGRGHDDVVDRADAVGMRGRRVARDAGVPDPRRQPVDPVAGGDRRRQRPAHDAALAAGEDEIGGPDPAA
jgi:hypothetical protein